MPKGIESPVDQWWLKREEGRGLDIDDETSVDALRSFMTLRAKEEGILGPSDAQVDALWGLVEKKYKYQERGFRATRGAFIIEPKVRFYIKGRRGGFGITRAREIYREMYDEDVPF